MTRLSPQITDLSLPEPLVTVVIPTYNRVALLQEAIASVMAQTYHNWELVIVDDGSTDGTASVIQLNPDQRTRVFELPHCGNIAALRNAGAKAGTGEWIGFLDADDIWLPSKLSIQIAALQQQGMLWSYGGYQLTDEYLQPIPTRSGTYKPCSGWITAQILSSEAAVTIGSLVVSRSLFDEVNGFDTEPKLVYREDYELFLRLSVKAQALALPDLLVKVREHSGRSTNMVDDGHARTAFVCQHFLQTKPGRKLEQIARKKRAYHLAEASVKSFRQQKRLLALEQWKKALLAGDAWRHLFSSFYRAMKIQMVKNR